MKKSLIFLLVILLAGCGSGFISELSAQPGDILYRDDFEHPSSGWDRSSTRVGSMDYYSGVYRILVQVPDYDLWSVAGESFQNVRIEVDAGRLQGPEENRIGLICRYRDPQNFYFFVISSDGYYALGKVSRGVRSLLDQPVMAYNPAILTGISPNHLQFECKGPSLTGSVNGQLIAITYDEEFMSGDVGVIAGAFGTSGTDAVFDNFVVTKP